MARNQADSGTRPTKESSYLGRLFQLSPKFGSHRPRTPAACLAPATTDSCYNADSGNRRAISAGPDMPATPPRPPTLASNSVKVRGYSSTLPAHYILGLPEYLWTLWNDIDRVRSDNRGAIQSLAFQSALCIPAFEAGLLGFEVANQIKQAITINILAT